MATQLPSCPHRLQMLYPAGTRSASSAVQCTGANPRYPRIAELKQLLIDAWERPIAETLTTEPGLGATMVLLS